MKCMKNILRNEHGVSGIVLALSMGMLLGISAITLDVGRAFVARGELQNIADASALAAAHQLGQQYILASQNNNNVIPDGWTPDHAGMVTAAQGLSVLHSAGGQSGITLNGGDVVAGVWDVANMTVGGGLGTQDAVAVQSRRDGTANGAIATFFARALHSNYTTMDVTRTATAALGPTTSAPPGTVNAPFGISQQWFVDGGTCNNVIRFSPANDPLACAGWHAFDEVQLNSNPNNPSHCSTTGGGPPPGAGGNAGEGNDSANAQLLRKILDCMAADNYTTPEVTAGETQFDFTNGEVADAFNNLYDLYDAKADHDADGNPTNWEVMIPIYQSTDCVGPSGPLTIVGFARAVVHMVDVDERIIEATVECNAIIPNGRSGPPGNNNNGLRPLGTIPNLVS